MAKRIPTQFIVAAYPSEHEVDKVEQEIMNMEFEAKQVLCTNIAVAKCDVAGRISIKEMGNASAIQKKPGAGKILGNLALLFTGKGTSKAAALGGSFSQYGASHIQGMDKQSLEKIAAALKKGTSAAILVFDEVLLDTEANVDFLREYKESTDSIVNEVAAKIDEALHAGKQITFHFCIDENGVAMTKEILGDDGMGVTDALLTPMGFISKEVDVRASGTLRTRERIITPDLYSSTRASLRGSTVAYTARAITEDTAEIEAGVFKT